jgi:hypothetical protein
MAGILSRVDPIDCLWRAALAFALGVVATQIWYVFFAIRTGPAGLGYGASGSLTDDQRES